MKEKVQQFTMDNRRAEKRAAQEIEQSSKYQARKKIYLAREKYIADAEKLRKLGNQHPE